MSNDRGGNVWPPKGLVILALLVVAILVGYLLKLRHTHSRISLFGITITGIPPFVGLPHDSPVEIAGGSIHVCSRSFKIPSAGNGHDWVITAIQPDDLATISTDYVTKFPSAQTGPNDGTWEIHIDDAGGKDAVTLISTKKTDNRIVIHTRDSSPLSNDGKAIILLPDNGVCATAGSCAVLQTVTIKANGGSTTGTCTNGKCGVYIGATSSTSAGVCEGAHQ